MTTTKRVMKRGENEDLAPILPETRAHRLRYAGTRDSACRGMLGSL